MSSGTTAGFASLRGEEAQTSKALDYTPMMTDLRKTFLSGKTKDLTWRKQQLHQLLKLCKENYKIMGEAVNKDHGGSRLRGLFDVISIVEESEMALKNLDSWAADEKVKHTEMIAGKSIIRKEPKGVVLVIAPWNYPIILALEPMVSALAAGNCCVLKPSEVSVHASALLSDLVRKYMDPEAVQVVEGAVAETTALLDQRFDHIFYTGNGAVARIICKKAAEHLTPVTLELGGKSPVYVDKTASVEAAANRISTAKWLNAGQTCVAPDYVLVHKDRKDDLIKGLLKVIEDNYGSNPKEAKDFGRVINSRHVARVKGLLDKSSGKVLVGGADTINAEENYMPPTLLLEPSLSDEVMSQEIFGPLLPILVVDDTKQAIDMIHKVCNDPLALYVFAEDKAVVDQVLNNTASGGACVNTAFEHLGNMHLPFGGVGNSGSGSYHGKFGFDEFTHRRAVLHKDTTFSKAAMLPLKGQDKIYDILVKLKITGFLTESQASALKMAGVAVLGAVVYVAAGKIKSML